MENQTQRLHARIEGRVQGVGFRYFTERTTSELNVTGWVRNRRDGTVEVVAEGDKETLDKLVSRLRSGPSAAFVSHLQQERREATGEFKEFRVRYTV